MSTGGIIGGILGGVLGFWIGGPMGALYGASIGFSLGMMIDPMTPDMPTVGTPLPMGADVMINTVGDPLPDLTGTAKITGHLLFYGKERSVPVEQEQEGGKGGGDEPDPAITGYEYYMSWGVGIVTGPIDTLYAIYKGDDLIWEGELDIPASGGQETIIIDGYGPPAAEEEEDDSILIPDPPEEETIAPSMGAVTFYFGTDDQTANTNVGDIIGDDTLNSPYRNFCWCFFDDCYIGTFNRCPTMKFIVRKAPVIAFSVDNEIQIYDYNPMHTIWYALHDLAGLPETWLHTEDFTTAATTLANETRGISCFFDKQQNTLDYLQTINNHIDSIIRYGSDGKFHPKLIRDDYTVSSLPLIDEDVMLDDPTFSRKAWGDTINEMKVQYTEIVERKFYTYELFGVGSNIRGQLGTGDKNVRNTFTLSISSKETYQIACADEATLIVKGDGTLWGAGYNLKGQLGLGEGNLYFDDFTQIGTDTNWAKVSSGYEQTFAIKTNGTLWATGKNEKAQAGVGHANIIYELVQVGTDTDWDVVSVGAVHSIAMKTNGTLWGAGQSSSFGSGFYSWEYSFVQVGTNTWAAISADYYCTLGIATDGTLWGVGDNYYGELGLGEGSENWWFDDLTQIGGDNDWAILQPTFGNSSFAIKTNGTLWATGQNSAGQLGLGDTTVRYVHNQVGTDTDWSKVVNSSGYYTDHSMAIKTDGSMYGCGRNSYGQLGIADKIDKHVFTKTDLDYDWQDVNVGSSFTIAIRRYIA